MQVKSLALFFDEIALLVPDYMRDRPQLLDPAIVAGARRSWSTAYSLASRSSMTTQPNNWRPR
jgi:hypothetical protein